MQTFSTLSLSGKTLAALVAILGLAVSLGGPLSLVEHYASSQQGAPQISQAVAGDQRTSADQDLVNAGGDLNWQLPATAAGRTRP